MEPPKSDKELREKFPHYKGALDKFDVSKYGTKTKSGDKDSMKSEKPKKKDGRKKSGPSSPHLPKGSHVDVAQTPTPQKNHNLLEESIFGPDPCVTEIKPLQSFETNLSRLVSLAVQAFHRYTIEDTQIDRKLLKEEFAYYSVTLAWLRLLDIKLKQQQTALTSTEKALLKAVEDIDFSVPKPIALFISQIGNVIDKMDKESNLSVPDLPVTKIDGFGGYHDKIITSTNHTLIQEVPTMGTAGDILMALASDDGTDVNWRMIVLEPGETGNIDGTLRPEQLPNYTGILPRVRQEVKNKLISYGITGTEFKEYVAGTRFNLPYLLNISQFLEKTQSFTIEKVNFNRMTRQGGITQVMKSIPRAGDKKDWRETDVHIESSSSESGANCGGAFVFGFQLYKDKTYPEGWLLAEWDDDHKAEMELKFAATANQRRAMPEGIGTSRFRSIGKEQNIATLMVVQRLGKTIT